VADIAIRGVTKSYDGRTPAVDAVDLDIADGELLVLVGPSGCGKSTLLRMIAGLEEVTGGAIAIGGDDVTHHQPKDRDIAMVFQSYALYPHMTVGRNIGYPLKLAGEPKPEVARRVAEVAEVLQLTDVLDRKPSQLSGGQRQRVAMGRAIIRHPRAFLMDEPLSNLDAKLRVEMRAEIARLQRELAVTTVYVTHDQTEAMTMGTRVAVLRDGRLQQVDAPQRLYDEPVNLFVATFIGSPAMNLFAGTIEPAEAAGGAAVSGAAGATASTGMSGSTGMFGVSGVSGGPAGGPLAVRIGTQRLPLDDAVVAAHPGVRDMVGELVVVGIRPEAFSDAAIEPPPPADQPADLPPDHVDGAGGSGGSAGSADGTTGSGAPVDRVLDASVDLVESLGAELIVHVAVTDPPAAGEEPSEPWRQVVQRKGRGVARLSTRTRAQAGDTVRLVGRRRAARHRGTARRRGGRDRRRRWLGRPHRR
jgi:multiple sugar transport system ATP-binding protein